MKRIKDFFKQLDIKLSYTSFCATVSRLGSPQLALAHYQNPVVKQKVLNKQHYTSYDKYQKIAKEHGLSINYIHYWAEQLETTKDIIAKEVTLGDYDHPFKNAYLYKSFEEKKALAIKNQPKFLRFKFR